MQSVQQEARDALLAIAGNKKQYQTLLTDLLVCLRSNIWASVIHNALRQLDQRNPSVAPWSSSRAVLTSMHA